MDKQKFLVIVDYSHGGFGFIVYAKKKSGLEEALKVNSPGRGIEIIEENIDEHPLVQYLGKKIEVYDLDNPTGLLQRCITESIRYFT